MTKRMESKDAKEMVHSLVHRNHREFHALHNNYRSNHSVSGLCTLLSLGASKERIKEYYDVYSKRLEPLETPRFKIQLDNWQGYIGDLKAYAEFLPFFEEQLKILGVEKALTKFIPVLLPGFLGALFHPLIQIGFGIEYHLPEVVAEGLAYACTYYYKVGEIINRMPEDDKMPSVDPLDILVEMKQMNIKLPKDRMSKPHGLYDELFESYDAELIQLASKWKINATTIKDIIEKLEELTLATLVVTFGSYRNRTIDLFVMHNVTLLQSIRVLLPRLNISEQRRLLQISLLGLLAHWWLQGMPDFDCQKIMDYGGQIENISWDEIIEKAIKSKDTHVKKVVRTLVVMRDNIPEKRVSSELILRSAKLTTDFIEEEGDWEYGGIGNKI